ncbi:EAL and modified HD-GYP domain-containing signal transduction protein [Chitinivorax tropicus]|uniref:EAL and modified HD-GYP domain-containing signal transduction protein n=1 Tax=Chitinivorax tropicus TaxID=714531 RepID=A0A840MF63_9PROT|nr:EAL domain-containing protein [Chitinivorax tropicus]MBB5017904.1 EAL and modified HD-GYP domain-containing signal transduction protein [Chitinivorax tropicus]
MDVNDFFLGRQPVVDRQQQLVGFELLFRRGGQNTAEITDDLSATATVINHACADVGIKEVLGPYFGLINVSADLLLSDTIELLPAEHIVLEILETVDLTPEVIARCHHLRQQGFRLALDDVIHLTPPMQALLPLISIMKLDIPAMSMESVKQVCRELAGSSIKVLAEKIDSADQFLQCKEAGVSLFQGYYFARPTIISGKATSPSETTLLRLLGLMVGDAETEEIEQCLKLSADLSINLMKMVNSVASGLNYKINSLHHAITVLGRRQLQRWLQLLLYTHGRQDQSGPSPLMQLASTRGRLMELLAARISPADKAMQERAFTVGLLSLLDALLNKPAIELLPPLNLADDINQALLDRSGPLGELLQLVVQTELIDSQQYCPILPRGLNAAEFNQIQAEALCWVNELTAEMH